jgi:hypothetical protein
MILTSGVISYVPALPLCCPSPLPALRPPPPLARTFRYADRLPGKSIILLTNDAANRAAAAALGLNAMSLSAYARSRSDVPELIDLVARQVCEFIARTGRGGGWGGGVVVGVVSSELVGEVRRTGAQDNALISLRAQQEGRA